MGNFSITFNKNIYLFYTGMLAFFVSLRLYFTNETTHGGGRFFSPPLASLSFA